MKPTIQFSHTYEKLLDEHNDVVDEARLLAVHMVNLAYCSKDFLAYDTDNGKYKLPAKGSYLMLLFEKPKAGEYVCARNLFTTLRRWTPQKEKYYRSLVGQILDIVISEEVEP